MNHQLMNLIIAENIMGWERKEFPFSEENWNPVRYWVDKGGDKKHRVSDWNPERKLDQAFEIIKFLKTKGYYVHLTQTDEMGYGTKVLEEDVWRCSFLDEQRNAYTEYHDDENIAICLAALKILEEKKEKIS